MMSPDLKWKQRAEVWLGTTALSTVAMGLTHSTLRMWECKSVCECDCDCVCVICVCVEQKSSIQNSRSLSKN